MSIIISTGNVGSGKTLSVVYDFYKLKNKRDIYTNIQTKGLINVKLITKEMFIKKELIKTIIKRDHTQENIYKYSVNKDFWLNRKEGIIDIVIDEAHTIFSSRKSSSRNNIIFTEFLSLSRKILSSKDSSEGNLYLISQTMRKLDVNSRDLARIRFHRCYYLKSCLKCNLSWEETSDLYEPLSFYPRCEFHKLKKSNHIIEIWKFIDEENFYKWKDGGLKSYYDHYFIPPNEVKKMFDLYNTLQFDDLFSDGDD